MTDLKRTFKRRRWRTRTNNLAKESPYVEEGPDVLGDLFDNYMVDDLVVAGAPLKLCSASLMPATPTSTRAGLSE